MLCLSVNVSGDPQFLHVIRSGCFEKLIKKSNCIFRLLFPIF